MTVDTPLQGFSSLDELLDQGTVLGRHRISGKLAEGAHAILYLGDHVVTGAKVAIKVLRRSFAQDTEMVARFDREAHVMGRLSGSSHVVHVHDVGTTPDGCRYLVMEYVPGRELGVLLMNAGRRESPLAIERVCGLARDIAAALRDAHHQGVVHRDLKPANIMVVRDLDGHERAKLVDFGVSGDLGQGGEGRVELTRAGSMIGTAEYMGPEQAVGLPATPQMDIFAFGVLLFEMLTGDLPPLKILRSGHVPPVTTLRKDVPAALADLVAACLRPDPMERPNDAIELLTRLNMATEQLGRYSGPVKFADGRPLRAAGAIGMPQDPGVAQAPAGGGRAIGVAWPGQSLAQQAPGPGPGHAAALAAGHADPPAGQDGRPPVGSPPADTTAFLGSPPAYGTAVLASSSADGGAVLGAARVGIHELEAGGPAVAQRAEGSRRTSPMNGAEALKPASADDRAVVTSNGTAIQERSTLTGFAPPAAGNGRTEPAPSGRTEPAPGGRGQQDRTEIAGISPPGHGEGPGQPGPTSATSPGSPALATGPGQSGVGQPGVSGHELHRQNQPTGPQHIPNSDPMHSAWVESAGASGSRRGAVAAKPSHTGTVAAVLGVVALVGIGGGWLALAHRDAGSAAAEPGTSRALGEGVMAGATQPVWSAAGGSPVAAPSSDDPAAGAVGEAMAAAPGDGSKSADGNVVGSDTPTLDIAGSDAAGSESAGSESAGSGSESAGSKPSAADQPTGVAPKHAQGDGLHDASTKPAPGRGVDDGSSSAKASSVPRSKPAGSESNRGASGAESGRERNSGAPSKPSSSKGTSEGMKGPLEGQADCEEARKATEAASSKLRWAEVLQHSRNPSCWANPTARLRMRVEALAELGRYAECVREGDTSRDAQVVRTVQICKKRIDAG